MGRMWLAFLQLIFFWVSQGSKVSAVGGNTASANHCSDPKLGGGVWQEGCLVKACNSGTVEESLADECVELIEKKVEKILGEKLAEKGIILAGGAWQNQVKLIKPDTKEVCNLPDLPANFEWSSMDLVEGSPVMCGSWFGSPGESRMKNETEKRDFFPVKSCVQLSPATKEAEWTIYTDKLSLKRDHVSLATPDGILLMGGYDSRSVTLLKPDGSIQSGVFNLERLIDRGCGIEDAGTLIITGGGSNGRGASVATKIVDRYNNQGFVENLPSMNYARTGHGCGYFHRDGEKVLVVGGGYFGRYEGMSETETFTMGSTAWSVAAPLPMKIYGFASVSLNNKVFFLAGDGKRRGASVLVLKFDGEKWEETQKVEILFLDDRYEGQSAVAVDLATSGFDEFCN